MIPHNYSQVAADGKNILEIGKMIAGARKYALQTFIPERTLERKFVREKTYSSEI